MLIHDVGTHKCVGVCRGGMNEKKRNNTGGLVKTGGLNISSQ